MARILVTDGQQRASLAVVRSLGAAGHEVHVGSVDGVSLAGGSKFASGEVLLPDPGSDRSAFVAATRAHLSSRSVDVLVPITESSLHSLLPHRDTLNSAVIPFPNHRVFDAICNKEKVLSVAEEIGIAVPTQRKLHTPLDAGLPLQDSQFPVVVKPSRSVVPRRGDGDIKTSVTYASDSSELSVVLDSLPMDSYPVLVQERIQGPGVGVFLLIWAERLVALFGHRRIREKPPSGGVSVYRESVAVDDRLRDASRRLLERFGWQGVAMVEFKRQATTGIPYLMEVNGRFWGSLQLAVDAGVDFPRLLVECALGKEPEPVMSYPTGVRTRWLLGDLDQLLVRLRTPDAGAGTPLANRGRSGAIWEFARAFWEDNRSEVLRPDDPWPALRELRDWVRNLATGGR